MNKGSDAELLPCPFCGGEVEKVFPPCSDLSEYIRHTEQRQCPLEFTAFYLDDDLATIWNTRALTKVEDTE